MRPQKNGFPVLIKALFKPPPPEGIFFLAKKWCIRRTSVAPCARDQPMVKTYFLYKLRNKVYKCKFIYIL